MYIHNDKYVSANRCLCWLDLCVRLFVCVNCVYAYATDYDV